MLAIRGRVVDDTGAPVRKFMIRSRPANEDFLQQFHRIDHPNEGVLSFTNDAGTFEIVMLEPGEWFLTALGKGDSRSIPKPVRVPQEGDVTLVLPREAVLTGTVLRPDGQPIAGANIYVGESAFPLHEEPRVRSGGEGAFRIEGLPAGRVTLHASHEDHCDSDQTEVVVPPGMSTSVQLPLTRGGKISGRVDPSQEPVSHRKINLYSHNGVVGWRSGTTDASGTFEFTHVIPQDYIVELRTPDPEGRRDRIRKQITVKADETVEVVLGERRPSIRLKGRIMCGEAPVSHEELSVFPMDETEEDRGITTRTDDQGRFSLSLNGAGVYGFRLSQAFTMERQVEDGAELLLQVPGGAISAIILSGEGQPVVRAGVTLLRMDVEKEFYKRYRRTKTLEDGSFAFRFLEPGRYVLRVPEGFQGDRPPPRTPHGRIIVAVKVGDLPLEKRTVRLPPEGRISGQVVDSLGLPCAAWIMVVNDKGVPQSADWETRSDSAGWFEVRSLAPGTYTLDVQSLEARKRSEPIQVEAGKTTEVKLQAP